MIQLFTRPECHLCDEAMAMAAALGIADLITTVDIEPDLKLLSRYGDKVPVLRWQNGTELAWPFDPQQLQNAHQSAING